MKPNPVDIPRLSRTSRLDVILIGLVLSFSVLAIFWISGGKRTVLPESKNVDIYQENQLIKSIDITENKTIVFPGVGMEIEISNGKVRVLKSDCPRQVCVNMEWTQHPGDTIVCVPNKILIEITSADAPRMDAVVS